MCDCNLAPCFSLPTAAFLPSLLCHWSFSLPPAFHFCSCPRSGSRAGSGVSLLWRWELVGLGAGCASLLPPELLQHFTPLAAKHWVKQKGRVCPEVSGLKRKRSVLRPPCAAGSTTEGRSPPLCRIGPWSLS